MVTPVNGVAEEDEARPSRFSLVAILWVALSASPVALGGGAEGDQVIRFDIPRQRADQALIEFAEQADVTFIFPVDEARKVTANAVRGEFTAQEAIVKLLAGTGLEPQPKESGAWNVSAEQSTAEKGDIVAKRGLFASLIAALAAGSAVPVNADQASEARSAPTALTEIIVTAQKREQSISDVPMSVAVLGGEEISRRNLVSMSDYLRTVPSVNQIDMGVGRSIVVMRGLTAAPEQDGNLTGSTVGIYLGDIPLTGLTLNGDNADIKLIDMERVEVLRGPQGTLFGESSLGGAVRNVPAAPNLSRMEGWLEGGGSVTSEEGSDSYRIDGVMNIPMIEDRLALRVAAYHHDVGGYVRNVARSNEAFFSSYAEAWGVPDLAIDEAHTGGEEYGGGRATLLWKPTDAFSVTAMYLYQDLIQDGLPDVQLSLPDPYSQTRLHLGAPVGGSERLEDNIRIASLTLQYDLGWASLVSTTASVRDDSIQNRDIGPFVGFPLPQAATGEAEAIVQELRIASNLPGRWQFLAGGYYNETDRAVIDNAYFGGDPSLNVFGADLLLGQENHFDSKHLAGFGEVSFDLTESLTITGGLRVFEHKRNDRSAATGPFSGNLPPSDIETKDSGTTAKLNLSYRLATDSLLYAQFAQGYRPGRPQIPLSAVLCDQDDDGLLDGTTVPIDTASLDADSVDSYEVGGKFSLMDGRLRLDGAVFRNDWRDIPIRVVGTCNFGILINAGEARTEGVELQGNLRITDHLLLGLGGSYIDAELTTAIPQSNGEPGDRLPGSPRFNINAALTYEFTAAGRDGFLRGDYTHVGGFYNSLDQTSAELGDYGLLDATFGMRFESVSVELYGKNLTNEDDLTWMGVLFQNLDQRAFRLRPRTIGLNLRYDF